MANNEHINKVVKSTGETLIDLTNDTVTPETLLQDVTAHDRSGAEITGTVIVAPTDVTEVEDNTAYLYKNSEHDAVYDELVGGSVAWNQLAKPISSWGYGNIDVSTSSDGVMTINGTASGNTTPLLNGVERSISGHKYYVTLNRTDLQTGISLYNDSHGIEVSNGRRIQESTGSDRWYLRILYGTVCDNVKVTPQIIDLTQMFGSTIADYVYSLEQSTAGSGIAWLQSYGFLTKDYYAYNAGSLVSVNTSGKKVVSETTSITYPIQSTDLRGLYKLNGSKLYTDGDIYSADGTITRKYGIVDLGTLEWNANGSYGEGQYEYTALISGKANGVINMICSTMIVQSTASLNCIRGRASSSNVSAVSSEMTKEAFKTAMLGVYLIYELATPTTETAQPFTSPQMVYRSGTEKYLDTRDVQMPVGGNRKYVDIPEWMVNEYFDDIRAEASNVSNLIEKLRRIDVSNGSSTTVSTIYAPDDSNGIRTTVRNNRTEVQVACGQALNANGKVVFTNSEIYGGIGNPTSASVNHFMFNDDCVGDSIGKLSSGAPLPGSEFDLNYEAINLNGSTINIDDNMSIGFETVDDFTVNTIKSPYIAISTDGISLSPKTTNQFDLLISRLPSGSGSELVINSNGVVYKSSSSRDIKHDIQYIENTESYHDALMRIKPATYVYNNDKTETAKLGMIAEDIADVMPIAALTGEGGKVENYDTRAIIAMLVMEVQRLNAEIERLRGDSDAN